MRLFQQLCCNPGTIALYPLLLANLTLNYTLSALICSPDGRTNFVKRVIFFRQH
jgi:hypothetical protein